MRTSSIAFVLALCLTGCPSDPDPANPPPGGGGSAAEGGGGSGGMGGAAPGKVEIVRDDSGVAHVSGDTEEAAFYGLGYATAEDRLFQMDLHRRYMSGRLAETFGGTGSGLDQLIEHDRRMRTFGYRRHAQAVLEAEGFPAATRALLEAYAAGVNAYAASASLPAIFAEVGVASFETWTAADCLLVWDRITDRFNTVDFDQEIETLEKCEEGACEPTICPGPVPLDEAAAVVPESAEWPPGEFACLDKPSHNTDPLLFKASHGWVVHGSHTASGEPILALDPKLDLTAPSFWHTYHITTPSYSARGIGLAGAPGFLIFWNERVGQTLTALGGFDVSDVYELALAPGGDGYVVDGVEKPFVEFDETIAVKGAASIPLTVRETELGPVVTELASSPPAGRAFALHHIELSQAASHSIVGAIGMMGASDMASYRAALGQWLLPGANSLFAAKDDESPGGHIGYHMAAGIPRRVANLQNGIDYRGRVPYDGSVSSTMWQGFLPLEERPHIIDPPSGYAFSANHLPVGSWYDDYAYTGVFGGGDTYRSYQLRVRLGEMFAAPGTKVTAADVHALHFDAGLASAVVFHDALEFLVDGGYIAPPVDPSAAAVTNEEMAGKVWVALGEWIAQGGEMRHENPITPLVDALTAALPFSIRPTLNPAVGCQYGGGEGGINFLLKSFAADPAGTMSDPAVRAFFILESKKAWEQVAPAHGNDPSEWRPPMDTPRFVALYQSAQFCAANLSGKCSLDPSHDLAVPLDAAFGQTLLSSKASSGTGTIDFADLDDAVMLAPLAASEDPEKPAFESGMAPWLAADAGDPASTPPAPLDVSLVTAVSTIELSYP